MNISTYMVVRFPARALFLFVLVCRFSSPHSVWRRAVSQPSTSRTIHGIILLYDVPLLYILHVFIRRVLLPLLLLFVLQCCCWCCSSCCCSSSCAGWKTVVVHWTWFHPVFSFSSFKHDSFLMYVPLGSTAAAFTASICLQWGPAVKKFLFRKGGWDCEKKRKLGVRKTAHTRQRNRKNLIQETAVMAVHPI